MPRKRESGDLLSGCSGLRPDRGEGIEGNDELDERGGLASASGEGLLEESNGMLESGGLMQSCGVGLRECCDRL